MKIWCILYEYLFSYFLFLSENIPNKVQRELSSPFTFMIQVKLFVVILGHIT